MSKWFYNWRGVETHQLESVFIFGIALLSMGFLITFKMVLIAFMLRYTKSIDSRAIPNMKTLSN